MTLRDDARMMELEAELADLRKANALLHAMLTSERGANERLRAALMPTAQTKAAYSGEFTMTFKEIDDYGDDRSIRVAIPWTSIKEIMRAIGKYADEQKTDGK